MKEGEVVIVAMPQANETIKNRAAYYGAVVISNLLSWLTESLKEPIIAP